MPRIDPLSQYPKPFARRIKTAYHNHKRRHGAALPFTMAEMAAYLHTQYARAKCPYCDQYTNDWSLDHATPVCRGGSWELSNYRMCCAMCNICKGPLKVDEWLDLLATLRLWPAEPAQNTLARLKAGSRIAKFRGQSRARTVGRRTRRRH